MTLLTQWLVSCYSCYSLRWCIFSLMHYNLGFHRSIHVMEWDAEKHGKDPIHQINQQFGRRTGQVCMSIFTVPFWPYFKYCAVELMFLFPLHIKDKDKTTSFYLKLSSIWHRTIPEISRRYCISCCTFHCQEWKLCELLHGMARLI